jgi:outer membrane protein TolC
MTRTPLKPALLEFRLRTTIGKALLSAVMLVTALFNYRTWSQTAPLSPSVPWHSTQEQSIGQEAQKIASARFVMNSSSSYSLAELIDLAQRNNPATRLAWERARAQADALGVARNELYPTLVAAALSQTVREQEFFTNRYFRQTEQSFGLALDLNYLIFDFGGRTGRINAAKSDLLAANFAFNDTHRRVIFQVQAAYYQLLNATGQEAAARVNLANAQTVLESSEESLKNGLSTLPDVLLARSAAAQASFDLQSALGAKDVAYGNLALALGASPLSTIPVQPIEELAIPDSIEGSVDEAIDRALKQRPDLMQQVAAIRSANARVKEARSAYYPALTTRIYPNPQALFGMQQQFPWGYTAGLQGEIDFNLRWTIFDGGARKNRLAEATNNGRATEAQAAATRDEIENGIWTAYSNLKTAFRQREAATALLQSATESYNAAIESYQYGVRNLIDVTQAQRTLAVARSVDVSARTQVLNALAALAFQAGDAIQPRKAKPGP